MERRERTRSANFCASSGVFSSALDEAVNLVPEFSCLAIVAQKTIDPNQ